MKLHECKPKTKVRIIDDISTPPGAPELKKGDEIFFDHLDGMYSYCLKGDEVVHLIAWAEVEVV